MKKSDKLRDLDLVVMGNLYVELGRIFIRIEAKEDSWTWDLAR